MSKFDYFNFHDGSWDTEFVAHAKNFAKEETIELCVKENDWKFDKNTAMVSSIESRLSKMLLKEQLGGIRKFQNSVILIAIMVVTVIVKGKGSFPVWVIEFEQLRV